MRTAIRTVPVQRRRRFGAGGGEGRPPQRVGEADGQPCVWPDAREPKGDDVRVHRRRCRHDRVQGGRRTRQAGRRLGNSAVATVAAHLPGGPPGVILSVQGLQVAGVGHAQRHVGVEQVTGLEHRQRVGVAAWGRGQVVIASGRRGDQRDPGGTPQVGDPACHRVQGGDREWIGLRWPNHPDSRGRRMCACPGAQIVGAAGMRLALAFPHHACSLPHMPGAGSRAPGPQRGLPAAAGAPATGARHARLVRVRQPPGRRTAAPGAAAIRPAPGRRPAPRRTLADSNWIVTTSGISRPLRGRPWSG